MTTNHNTTSFRRLAAAFFMGLLVSAPVVAQPGQVTSNSGGDDAVARFLMNFGRFIDWPAASFSGADADLKVCVVGDDHLGRALDQNVNGKRAGDRNMSVSRLGGDAGAAASCHIVWISASEAARADSIASALDGKAILTVSEVDTFLEKGGMIGLTNERGNQVAIRMNRNRIESAGMNVREQLMRAIQ